MSRRKDPPAESRRVPHSRLETKHKTLKLLTFWFLLLLLASKLQIDFLRRKNSDLRFAAPGGENALLKVTSYPPEYTARFQVDDEEEEVTWPGMCPRAPARERRCRDITWAWIRVERSEARWWRHVSRLNPSQHKHTNKHLAAGTEANQHWLWCFLTSEYLKTDFLNCKIYINLKIISFFLLTSVRRKKVLIKKKSVIWHWSASVLLHTYVLW